MFAVLDLHSHMAEVVEQVLGLLSSVTLRQPKHCLKIATFDGVPLIVEALKQHPKVHYLPSLPVRIMGPHWR